jgi:AcrR family transcriptional regulator
MPVVRPDFPDHGSPFSREQERKRKEAAILSAAARRFDREGVHSTRLEDIASDLGLTKTSIAYYFASKEDLVAAAFRASSDFLADAVAAALADEGDAASRLLALFQAYLRQLDAIAIGDRPYVAAIHGLEGLSAELRDDITERVTRSTSQIHALVDAWSTDSHAALGRVEPATSLVFGLLNWLGSLCTQTRTIDREAAGAAAIDLLQFGLSARQNWTSSPLRTSQTDVGVSAIFDRDARNLMKREAFLRAGTRFFNQCGFGGVALSEVAASLGVTRGAFYYHFPDKGQLLDECMDRSLAVVEAALTQAEQHGATGLDVVEHALRDIVYQQASGMTPLLRPALASALPEARQRRHEARLRNIARRFGDALEQAMSDGSGRSVDVAMVEQALTSVAFLAGGYAQTSDHATRWRMSEDPLTASVDYTYILVRGVGAP